MEGPRHVPVLLKEVLEYLDCKPDRVYVDGTVGRGGHAREILDRCSPTGRLIGLDWDQEAIALARENLASFGRRVELRKENFKELASVLESLSLPRVDGILLDLGLSTEQLESRERGFSFRWDGPLDMRMDQEIRVTARDLLEKLSASEMSALLRQYGEERWAQRIARNLVRVRRTGPLRTTRQLVELIERSIPTRRGRIHPATRTFQALRIAVNDELQNLVNFLHRCPDLLNPGGRLCIISYHSLEDRIVKAHFHRWTRGEGEEVPSFRLLTPKPVLPSPQEILSNPRARSAKMRTVEKISALQPENRRREVPLPLRETKGG